MQQLCEDTGCSPEDRPKEWSRVSYKSNSPGIYSFDEISAVEFSFEKLSCVSKILFYIFLKILLLFDGIRFLYTGNFPFFCAVYFLI